MKKINVLFAFVAVLVILGGFFACQVDTAERITVTFEDPSGGNPTKEIAIVKGSSLGGKMPTLSRDGPYKFYGWFEGQNQYFKDTSISVDITLTARWEDDVVSVSFAFTQTDAAGNVIQPTASIPPVTAIKGLPLGPLAFPVAPRAKGWEFDSWLMGEDEFTVETIVPGPITLSAKWVAKTVYTVIFDPGPGGGNKINMTVYANECIDEWETRFPPNPTVNTVKPSAFFVAWFDDENRPYDGREPIRRNNLTITGKWGLPPYFINFDTEVSLLEGSTDAQYGNVDYSPRVVDSVIDGKRAIVNTVSYDVPYNTNRWRILYRISLSLPADFNVGFYTRYTIRARFYANQQGAKSWTDTTAFTPNEPADQPGYSEAGWLRKKDYAVVGDDGKWKEYSRSEDGWGQISWTSVANWNGQGADEQTMLQRYNLDRKGGTINDTWAPLRSKELAYPPFLLIQTSDAYIGHIEVTEIVFHNGEFEQANYEGEKPPESGAE